MVVKKYDMRRRPGPGPANRGNSRSRPGQGQNSRGTSSPQPTSRPPAGRSQGPVRRPLPGTAPKSPSPTPTPVARPPIARPPAPGAAKPASGSAAAAAPKVVRLPAVLTVRDLGTLLGVSPIDVMKRLISLGIMANINQQIDYDTAAIVASELGFETEEIKPEVPKEEEDLKPKAAEAAMPDWRALKDEKAEDLRPRPPVVTVMGHVDHGKTSLLDAIRNTNVVAGEAGGITQHIGAYQVELQGKKITFLDTPGHEAFTAMRARGAQATDITILVVAADDGVMPQTKEAIAHAKAAKVPIIVALNKIDRPNANPELVKQQLSDAGLTVEDWGGDVICVPVSAKLRTGIEDLLENVLLVSDVADLRANPDKPAIGVVVEGRMDKTRGPIVTLLVQGGTLRVGADLVIDTIAGRVRAMQDDKGEPLHEATPSTPVVVMGLPEVPRAGDTFEVVADEKTARAMAEERTLVRKAAAAGPARKAITLEEVFGQMQQGKIKELNLVLKADVQGSLEPIQNSLLKLGGDQLKVKVIFAGTGNITESDIMLAVGSATVIGFNVTVDAGARSLAEQEGVDIRHYEIIYKLIEDIDKALQGMLEPVYKDVVTGHCEVRQVFKIGKKGNIAGCVVTDGQATRTGQLRVKRGTEVLVDKNVGSLKRFTEDVKEVAVGMECGVSIDGFEAYEVGDILEFYHKERAN
jgi:translation initiation factor IF-2